MLSILISLLPVHKSLYIIELLDWCKGKTNWHFHFLQTRSPAQCNLYDERTQEEPCSNQIRLNVVHLQLFSSLLRRANNNWFNI